MNYVVNTVRVKAISFDDFLEYGRAETDCVGGMPWSFKYDGMPVSHENDDRYLINTPEATVDFYRGHMLITEGLGEVMTIPCDVFSRLFTKCYVDKT